MPGAMEEDPKVQMCSVAFLKAVKSNYEARVMISGDGRDGGDWVYCGWQASNPAVQSTELIEGVSLPRGRGES